MRDSPDRFLNRELSWLDFNRRVLELARDPDRPPLERAKFLAIYSRNLDEFFQVRVSGLQDRVAAGGAPSPDGRSPAQQIAEIREQVIDQAALAHETLAKELKPTLAAAGIDILEWRDLDADARDRATEQFDAHIQPVLIPLAVDPAHPFPYVSALSLSVGAFARPRGGGAERLARVKVPPFLPRWVPVGEGRFVAVEEVIRAHLGLLFPEDEVIGAGFFRVTRDADLELEERSSGDLVKDVEAGLQRRLRGSDAVRLEVSHDLDARIRELLVGELRLERDEVYEVPGLLDLGGLWELYGQARPDLKDPAWPAVDTFRRQDSSPDAVDAIFRTLRERDVLVHHPYESFEGSVEAFLRAAADDPSVRVIMSTIYRTGGPESSIVRALQGAASRGKQIVVLVELKARFDEAANLDRARALERAGAHVVYGVLGLKTHAKLAFVLREEGGQLRRYCHVGTGNYNPITARLYEDLGLLTSEDELTRDVAELFQRLTSGSGSRQYDRLMVAPEDLREGLVERIDRESREPDGRIVMKVNSVSDPEVIDALYDASRAGADIDLVVRGICCLRPGVEGLSETIRVRSILGRFLEHSRIFRFGSDARGPEYWIGSADVMGRNLDLRVEALVKVESPALCARLDRLLDVYLDPDARAWALRPDGTWKRTGGSMDVQERLHRMTRGEGS